MVFYIECPHCNQTIEVVKRNCRIFRCGIYKHNFQQIHPHLPQPECDKLFENDEIYGCGKPFQLVQENEKWIPIKCDYI